jgi:hypothetical protein
VLLSRNRHGGDDGGRHDGDDRHDGHGHDHDR